MLIAAAQLREQLQAPDWIVFDCRHDLVDHARGGRLYQEAHIPGAYFAPVETALAGAKTGVNGRHPLPEANDVAEFLNQHGVTSGSRIVAYDDVGGQYAARLWWLVRWIGGPDVSLLDGGWSKWVAEGHPATATPPPARTRGAVIARPDGTKVRGADEILAALHQNENVIIDARAPERFRGEVEPIDRVAGHIPSARNRFFKTNLNADHTMRPAPELRREFEALLGSAQPQHTIHQCGSGITACANLFAMEYAGLAGSKLYAGSWSEWIADPSRPVARGV